MKTLLLFLLTISVTAQFRLNETESFNIGILLDPHASFIENGLNIGAEIEYKGTVYVRAGVTYFGVLNPSYLDIVGTVGVNFTSDIFERTRYYTGLRAGIINREGNTYPTIGAEVGFDYQISDGITIGLRGTYDRRGDFEFYNESPEFRKSGFIKLGFKF